jgi:hypothetical protein
VRSVLSRAIAGIQEGLSQAIVVKVRYKYNEYLYCKVEHTVRV